MRTLSATAKRAIFAQDTDEVFLVLLTIATGQLPVALRFVNNTEDIVSRGSTFLAAGFMIGLPDETDQAQPHVQIQIDNVDRRIVTALRTLPESPSVIMEIVLASNPDVLEAGPFNFTLQSADYTAEAITGNLTFENFLTEAFPVGNFDPARFPGLFVVMCGIVNLFRHSIGAAHAMWGALVS